MEQTEPKKKGRKPQWTDTKVEIMCKAIAAGKSYKDAFTAARVSKATFYAHLANDSDFSYRVKKAEQEYQDWYDSQLVVDCKRSLLELVQGYEWDETTTESALDKNGKMDLARAHLMAFAHGEYFALGKKLSGFGDSARKKKKSK